MSEEISCIVPEWEKVKIKKTYSHLSLNSVYLNGTSLNVMSWNCRVCHCCEKGMDFIPYFICSLCLITGKIPFVILKMGNKSQTVIYVKIFGTNVSITSLKIPLTVKYYSGYMAIHTCQTRNQDWNSDLQTMAYIFCFKTELTQSQSIDTEGQRMEGWYGVENPVFPCLGLWGFEGGYGSQLQLSPEDWKLQTYPFLRTIKST